MNTAKVKLTEIQNHPDNARRGNIDIIMDSIDSHGQYKPLIVQKSTGYIIAGNHTYKALKELGKQTAEVIYLDVDDNKAREIMLIDNKSSDAANYDRQALYNLLTTEGLDISATGYNINEYERLKTSYLQSKDAIPVVDSDELERLKSEVTPEIEEAEKMKVKIDIDRDVLKQTLAKLAIIDPDCAEELELDGELVQIIRL